MHKKFPNTFPKEVECMYVRPFARISEIILNLQRLCGTTLPSCRHKFKLTIKFKTLYMSTKYFLNQYKKLKLIITFYNNHSILDWYTLVDT